MVIQDFVLLDHEGLGETFEAVLGVHLGWTWTFEVYFCSGVALLVSFGFL